jgi:hypothetical protein
MSQRLLAIAALPVVLVAASFLHELAHMAVADALDADPQLRGVRRGDAWWTLTWVVEYELPEDAPTWQPALVGAAPLLTGLCVGALWLASGHIDVTPWVVVGAAGWAIFSLSGGPEDYRALANLLAD